MGLEPTTLSLGSKGRGINGKRREVARGGKPPERPCPHFGFPFAPVCTCHDLAETTVARRRDSERERTNSHSPSRRYNGELGSTAVPACVGGPAGAGPSAMPGVAEVCLLRHPGTLVPKWSYTPAHAGAYALRPRARAGRSPGQWARPPRPLGGLACASSESCHTSANHVASRAGFPRAFSGQAASASSYPAKRGRPCRTYRRVDGASSKLSMTTLSTTVPHHFVPVPSA